MGVVKNAHIVNTKNNLGTFTNNNGEFEITVSLADEIIVTSIQHETELYTIANITLKTKELNVVLKRKVYELEEFEIKKHNLIGSLSYDLNEIPIDNTQKVDAKSLGLPNANGKILTPIERKLHTATSSSAGIPLDLILNLLSGRLKKLKQEAKVISENNDVNYMYKHYRFFIQDYYKISDDDLYKFLYFCVADKSYVKNNLGSELKMISFLKEMSLKFKSMSKKNNVMETPNKN